MTDSGPEQTIVAIVGSKPDPVLPERVETMVFCNGSIYLLDRPDIRPRQVWHCITNSALLEAKEGADLVRPKLAGKHVDLLIEITTLAPEGLDYSWSDLDYSFAEKAPIANADKGELTFWAMDRRFYLDLLFSPCPVREKISAFWNTFWRKKKPAASTGILALLYAMREMADHGDVTFVLCGIGLVNDGYEFWRKPVARGHICIDYCVLRSLSRFRKGARVFVSDRQLSEMVGLPLFEA